MRRLLLLSKEAHDLDRLSATLPGGGHLIATAEGCEEAIALLSERRFDALVITEPLCRSNSRPHTMALVQTAERLNIPVLLLPGAGDSLREEFQRLRPLPLAARRTSKRGPRRHCIEGLFEESIRPAFQARGGDVELVDVIDGRVVVRFLGVCSVCPAARSQHREEIERFLKAEAPDVKCVVVEEPGFPPGRWW